MRVDDWCVLAEARRQFPDKWHGLTDVEARYRQRYLDLLAGIAVVGLGHRHPAPLAAAHEQLDAPFLYTSSRAGTATSTAPNPAPIAVWCSSAIRCSRI